MIWQYILSGLKLFLHFLWANLLILHKGTAIAKFKSTLILSIVTALPLGIVETITHWITQNGAYIFFVLVAITFDHLLGSAVHLWVKKDFSFKKNIIGIFTKLALVFAVGVLFEGFQYIYSEKNLITDYLSVITRLMVFLYPAGSAFMNCALLTNGKFPPVGWMQKITKFNQNLDMNEFKRKTDGDEI